MQEPSHGQPSGTKRAHTHWWDPAWNRTTWVLFTIFMATTAVIVIWSLLAANRQSTVDAATQITASHLANGPVEAFRGPKHTVYQATAPLPTAKNPRSDGRLTLAWLSGTNCSQCEKMTGFVWDTLKSYTSDFVVMEKDLGRQPAGSTFGVTKPPEFVLLSADGKVLARFGYQADAAALKRAVNEALAKAKSQSG